MKNWRQPLALLTLITMVFLVGTGGLVGCRQTIGVSKRPSDENSSSGKPPGDQLLEARIPEAQMPEAHGTSQTLIFRGACDASGAVPLDGHRFLVADDEDNTLRVFDASRAGEAVATVDLSTTLASERKKKEFDLEAATRLDDAAFFITSHGRNSKGKREPSRLLFFALSLLDPSYNVVGKPYEGLLAAILSQPIFADLDLAEAAKLAPKAVGGLNIEGLTATPEGHLWVGLRNPVPSGRSILFRIDNPTGTVHGEAPVLSSLTRLDLGGLGVRALSSHRGQYLIIAGPPGEGGPFRLYRWDGNQSLVEVPDAIPPGLNPEGFFTPESSPTILMLSDDGSRMLAGKPCKKLKDSSRKQFRAFPLRLP